jgi:predicted amidohydrolase YtcJ
MISFVRATIHRALIATALLAVPHLAFAQAADLVVTNAKIATLDAKSTFAQAMAIRDGKIIAVGNTATINAMADSKTKKVDAAGRLVIPGLIDSHIHAIRAALSYSTEVNWIDVSTIPEAMERLKAMAARSKPGTWIIVAGGWTEQQFAEKRKPTLAEVMAAVPNNPVWVQLFYSTILMNPKAMETLNVTADGLAPRVKPELDAQGKPTGWLNSDIISTSQLFDKLPKATYEDNIVGTQQFFTELNRLGITGVIDVGGFSLVPSQYKALLKAWREQSLSVRVAYNLFAQTPGTELAEFQNLTNLMPMSYGDDMLRFNGIGERVTLALYNNHAPTDAIKEKFYEVIRWAAQQRLNVTIHWQEDKSVHHLLELYERLNKEIPITDLRWSIAHLDDATPETFARMKALGIGWTMQDAMYFAGDAYRGSNPDKIHRVPPIMTALKMGINMGAGSDAHRVATYNPFIALRWILDGKTVGGNATRGADETPSRDQALRMYTQGSAWFSFDEKKRGTLEVGKLADFAILDQDFFTVPVENIAKTGSLMTVVGGKIVYSAKPY